MNVAFTSLSKIYPKVMIIILISFSLGLFGMAFSAPKVVL